MSNTESLQMSVVERKVEHLNTSHLLPPYAGRIQIANVEVKRPVTALKS